MRKRIRYTNEPLGRLKLAKDFLPRPEALAFREEAEKVTISLSKRSLDFFRLEAERHGTRYQPMIRRLLDAYVNAHSASNRRGRSRLAAR